MSRHVQIHEALKSRWRDHEQPYEELLQHTTSLANRRIPGSASGILVWIFNFLLNFESRTWSAEKKCLQIKPVERRCSMHVDMDGQVGPRGPCPDLDEGRRLILLLW
jgi:hypothetical protein